MLIIIKFLLTLCLYCALTKTAFTDGSALEPVEEKASTDNAERAKRLSTIKLKDTFDKIGMLDKKIADKFDSSVLGSIRNSPLLKTKTKLPSLLDGYKSSIGSSLPRLDLVSLLKPSQTMKQITPTAPTTTTPKTTAATAPINSKESVKNGSKHQSSTAAVSESKPIVLPDYLKDEDDGKQHKKKHASNQITVKQLKETANLRNEIKYAVNHQIYVHSSSEVKNMNQKDFHTKMSPTGGPPAIEAPTFVEPPPPPPVPSFENYFSDFWQNLIGRKSPFQSFNRDSNVGSVRSDFSYVPDSNKQIIDPSPQDYASNNYENTKMDDKTVDADDATVETMMAKAAMQAMQDGIVSNTVESYANNDERPNIEMNHAREELNMTSIVEDMNFDIGETVIGWRTLKRNKHESHALIGMTNTSIVLVHEKNGAYKMKSEEQLLSTPTHFTTYTFWNDSQHSIDGIVIVSIQHEIVFYRINEAMDRMEFIWMWPTTKPASYIQHFVIDNFDTLLVITESYNGKFAASLYRFDMNQMEFFLRESLSLDSAAKNMALIQNGYDTFMCFPQQNHVIIFKYMEQNFKYYTKIESNHAEILTAFEMGSYSYLAIGGNWPKILRYSHGKFYDQTILTKSWGFVEFFLPVSARTYRDDLILFVQHRIDYGSHTNAYLEALIWNGRAFYAALSVPCYIGDRISDLGLGCMLDQDRTAGVIGATTFQRNRTISILVPRHEAHSGLFDLNIELSPARTSVNDHLLELFSEIIILLNTREEVLKNAQNLIEKMPKGPVDEINVKGQHLKMVHTQSLELGSIIPTEGVFLNEERITKELVDEFYGVLNEAEETLTAFKTMNRNKREDSIKSLHVDSVNVTDLYVDYINDIPAEDFIFIENGNVVIDGTVVINQSIEAEVVERASDDMRLRMEQESADSVVISGNLKFDEVNGVKWKDLISETVLKYLPVYLDEMTVNGTVFAKDSISTENLNDLPFPSGYVFTDGTEQIVVTGQKTFQNVLVTETLYCLGTLNGVAPSKIVTLTGSQFIPGTTTFRHLEITNALNIGPNGTISGRHLDDFLSNPTLRETNQIRANCYINSLEIDGPLYITNTINDVFLDDILSDIVYKHEPSPQINSLKTFASLQAPNIQLKSNIVNGIPFSSFVTKDTEQTFHVNKLNANVQFDRLKLDGLFNFINITELDENAIKLFGDQYTNAKLIFEDGDYINIDAGQLEVLETINNISVHDFVSIDEDFDVHGDVFLNGLNVNRLVVGGDIVGSPDNLVNGVHLQKLFDSHLSKNNAQTFNEPVHFGTVILRNGFNASTVNEFDFKDAVNILTNLKTNEQMLNASKIIVDRMFINGSVWFDQLNGYDIEYFKQNAIHLDQSNVIDFPILFLDPVYVNGDMNVNQMNSENFNAFVEDLVRKSANKTRIYGTTTFEEDVTVLENAEVTTINDQQVDFILTKNYNREIINPIEIRGNVFIPNLFIDGELNGISSDQLNTYSYDELSDTFSLKKDVYFNETINIKYLDLYGGYNNIGNIQQHLKDVIRTDRSTVINATIEFTESVHFENGISIVEYNNVNVPEFLSNVILIDQYDPVDIASDVVFEAPATIPNLKVAGDLVTSTINNCTITDWIQKSIRTDQPYTFNGSITFPPDTFAATNINTRYINGFPVDEILTLKTPQNFSRPVKFDDVYASVPILTNGLVSGYDLRKERENTLMSQTSGDQYIDIPVVFSSVRVLKNLVTDGLVDGRDLRLAACLQDNIIIDSPLSFGSVTVDKLYTNHLISGINFDAWTENALQRWKPVPQVVTAPWHIKTIEVDTFNAEKRVNGLEPAQFLQNLDQSKQNYDQNHTQTCHLANQLINDTRKNVALLSHFENVFNIETPNSVNSIHLWNTFNQNYMVINSGCESFLYMWNLQNDTFEPLSTVVTGDVKQWIHVQDADGENFLISNNDGSMDSSCQIGGAFIWRLDSSVNLLIEEVQFGRVADFRSLRSKPNSHAVFYALRNADNHLVEYNLRGAIITEWNMDTVAPTTASENFVPGEANLGLALLHGDTFSILTTCNCTKRNKRCSLLAESVTSVHRQQFGKTIAQLHTDLHNGRNLLRSILNSNEFDAPKNNLSSILMQKRLERLKELVQSSKEKTSHILSSVLPPLNTSTVDRPIQSEMSNDQSETLVAAAPIGIFESNIDGKVIVNLMDAIDNAVEEKKSVTTEMPMADDNESQQSVDREEDEMVGTGADLVDLMDLIKKVIEENNEKHKQQDTDENENENQNENANRIASSFNRTEMGQMLNDSLALKELLSASKTANESDSQVGTLFGMFMLEQTLAKTLSKASKVLLGDDEKTEEEEEEGEGVQEKLSGNGRSSKFRKHKKEKSGLIGSLLGSTHTASVSDPVEHYKELVNALQEIRNLSNSNATMDDDDTQVGDQFGDLLFKLTPITDKIFDSIIDEIKRRDHQNRQPYRKDLYSVGSVNSETSENILSNNSHPQFRPSDVVLMMHLMDGIDEKLAKNSSDEKISVGSGWTLVNLIDMIDEIIKKNNEKHKQSDKYEDDEYTSYHNVGATLNKTDFGQMLNASLNLHSLLSTLHDFDEANPTVGTLFGTILLEKTIADTISTANLVESKDDNANTDSLHTKQNGNAYHVDSSFNKTEMGQMLNDSLVLKELPTASKTTNESKSWKVLLGGDQKPEEEEDSKGEGVQEKLSGNGRSSKFRKHKKEKSGLIGSLLGSTHTASVSDPVEHYKELVNALQAIRNLSNSNATKDDDDTQDGDQFGDLMFKLTPITDKIFDSIIDEIKRRDHQNHQPYRKDLYPVGSVKSETSENILSNNSHPQFRPSDVVLMMHLMNGIDAKLAKNSSDEKISVGSGWMLVNLIDMIDEIIKKNNEKHKQSDKYEDDGYTSYHNVGATLNKTNLGRMLNDSLNMHSLLSNLHDFDQENPTVGTFFGTILLEKTIADTISRANSDSLQSTHVIANSTNEDSIEHILELIAKAENITLEANSNKINDDVQVGDAFGELMFKITPLADNIMDKIVDELRRRQNGGTDRRDAFKVGSAVPNQEQEIDSSLSSKMNIIFKKIGKSLVKAYIFGYKHFEHIQNLAKDIKYLYDIYNGNGEKQKEEDDNEMLVIGIPMEQLSMEKHGMLDTSSANETQKEIELIYKMIPNAKEFSAAFAAEMIQSFGKASKPEHSQDAVSVQKSFWPIFMNGVKAALVLHANHTDPSKNVNDTELNEKIYAKFIHDLNEMANKIEINSSSGLKDKVGSPINDPNEMNAENLMFYAFNYLFEKFTPLIDYLSEITVQELQQRQNSNNLQTNNPNALKSSQIQSNEIDETTTELISTSTEKIINENVETNRNNDDQESQNIHHLETTIVSIPNLLPSQRNTEIVALKIASNQQQLVAVCSVFENTIKSDHDRIQIFENVVEGKVFQTIACYKPRNLITFTVNMDTILAFIQDETEVKTYIYRDGQGFVEFSSFKMESPIKQMIQYDIVTHPIQLTCPESFLVLIMDNRADFIKAVTVGDCRISGNLNC